MIWLFITLLPTLVEAYLDRHGETKEGKKKDFLWAVVASIGIAGVAWWLGEEPLPVIGLILAWRILIFDYLVTYLLIKNDVINPNAKWWSYTGESTKWWDQLIRRVPWKVRLIIRVVLFTASVLFFIL